MMRSILLVVAVSLSAAACSDIRSCPNACDRAFSESECHFGAGLAAGGDPRKAIRECTRECENALRQTGDLDGYDPDDYNSVDRSRSFELKNEAQAAAWIDCVSETSCQDINDGFCPGGGIN